MDASDLFDPYGGSGNLKHYKCLEKMSICDTMMDCADGSDEVDCKFSLG